MQIFNVHVNGLDAKWFCELPKETKIEWIKKNTNCQSDVLIEEFLNSPIKDNDCGCGCGGNKAKSNGNISKGISEEIGPSNEVASTSGISKRTSNKRRGNNKAT